MSLDQLDASRRRGGFAPKENIPLQIDAYDKTNPSQHLAVGTRLDTGEQIKVFLLPDPKAGQRKYERAEIADYAKGPRDHKSSTDIGGVILFEKSQQVAPGVYSSEWGTVLSHTPVEAQVSTGLVRVDRPRGTEGNISQKVEVLHNNEARQVNSPAELKEFMLSAFSSQEPGVPGVYLRVDATNKDGQPETKAYKVGNTFTETITTGGKTVSRDTPEVSYQKFLDSPFGKTFMQLASTGELKNVEAIPVSTLYVGKDSIGKSDMSKNYQVKGENSFGFAESTLAVRQRDNGSFYATVAAPLRTDKVLYTPETAPTQGRAGEPAPVEALDDTDPSFDGAALEADQAAEAELAPLEAAAQQPARPAQRRFG